MLAGKIRQGHDVALAQTGNGDRVQSNPPQAHPPRSIDAGQHAIKSIAASYAAEIRRIQRIEADV